MSEVITPARLVGIMVEYGATRARLSAARLLVRSALAGAILGVATTFAFTATAQTGLPIVGALVFPVGLAIIMVLGLDLITGSFALLPMAVIARRATMAQLVRNWVLTFVGNYAGSLLFALLMWIALTSAGHDTGGPVGDRIRAAVAARSAGYEALGTAGLLTVFVKAMLCNWLVVLGITMGLAASTSAGKIIGCWPPIVIFFALSFEHTVVNMALFPLGLMLGAPATVVQYLLWNELPVIVGNLVGGFTFTGLALYIAHDHAHEDAETTTEAAPRGTRVLATS